MFVIAHPDDSRRLLCRDGRFRWTIHFGNMGGCVKEYKTMHWAAKIAQRFKGKSTTHQGENGEYTLTPCATAYNYDHWNKTYGA